MWRLPPPRTGDRHSLNRGGHNRYVKGASSSAETSSAPESNVFDARCGRDLDAVSAAANETADGLRDRRVDADLPWIWMLDGGDRLFLEVEQNLLQPTDGRCVLRFIAQGSNGATSVARIWPWAFLAVRGL